MPTKKLTNLQEIEDFVRGCTLFATGGGGLPSNGVDSLVKALDMGCDIGWVDISEIPDDSMSVCPFLMGSIAPHTDDTVKEMAGYGMSDDTSINPERDRMSKAIGELEEYSGHKFNVIVPIELAGANTSAAIAAGAMRGMITADGDYTGRAIPEIIQITFNYEGHSLLPVASVDEWGNVCIIKNSINPRTTEHLGKLISVAGYGLAGQAGMALESKLMKQTIIPGTLSECYEAGRLLREAKESNEDPIGKLLDRFDGYEIGRGTVIGKDDKDEGGYYWGTYTVQADSDVLKIWFKNENHVLWKNDKPYVTSPDLICAINLDTFEPIPNPWIESGQHVAIVAFPCKPQQEETELLTPKYFGFDFDHVPLKELMKSEK